MSRAAGRGARRARGRWIVPIAVAIAWSTLILVVHRDSPRTLVSAHGLLHAAIADSFADPANRPPLATPPENPLFAGTPLPYYFFFHAVGAQLAGLLGIDVIHAFELLIVLAAFVTVLLGFVLLERTHALPQAVIPGGIAFALLFFAGTNPQGPLVLLAKWMREGSEPLQDRGQYLWGLVHPINGAMRIGDYWGALGPLSTYFFNVTARPLALASLVVVLVMIGRVLFVADRGSTIKASLLGLVLSSALVALWSPLLGIASGCALAAALVFDAFRNQSPAAFRRHLARVTAANQAPQAAVLQKMRLLSMRAFGAELFSACALVLGIALAWPWYRHLIGAGGEIRIDFNAKRALGVVASAWLLAWLAFRKTWMRADAIPLRRVLLLAGLLLALPTAFVALPVGNEDNFLHAALVCWSVLGASVVLPAPKTEPEPAPGGG